MCVCVVAERFGKKLEELSGERGALKLGLPSTQPSVALFLQQLRQAVDSALQRPDCAQWRSVQPSLVFKTYKKINTVKNGF